MNCRTMEVSIFPKVNELLNRFVEIRLHVDVGDEARKERIRSYQVELAKSSAIPYYVIVDPDTPRRARAIYPGADLPTGSRFKAFLEKYLAKNG